MLALANTLIDHPERTLNGVEIDQCIAHTHDLEAKRGEAERRAKWTKVMGSATDFITGLEG